jgi:hypothetical protein
MIVYLGMPRCASSWIYDHLIQNQKGDMVKETHHLYTNPVDLDNYCLNRVLDFSTNNWSMDSNIAREIDPWVSKYIFVFRDPVELAASYQGLVEDTQTLDQFVTSMLYTKLLCFGDIIERWYQLVDPAKILIYQYNDVVQDSAGFVNQLVTELGAQPPTKIDPTPSNIGTRPGTGEVSERNRIILDEQVEKFSRLTGIKLV